MSESLGEAVLELSTDNTRLKSGMAAGERTTVDSMGRMRDANGRFVSSTTTSAGVVEGSWRKMSSPLTNTAARMRGFSLGMSQQLGHIGHSVRGLGMSMGLMALPLIEAGREGVAKLGEMQLANRQTAAVIKSTGAAAHVSAADVHELSEKLGDVAGVSPQLVQAGENMMLTFRGVQDRAGKGNDIFHQASAVMMDFGTAMKIGPRDAALALGKALNDPATGMTRLQRMGVMFTESQKKAAKAMEGSGNIAGAQKIVLDELNKEFGGSAAAAGKTFPAAMARLKEAFETTAATMISTIMPQLKQLFAHIAAGLKWFNQLSPSVKHFAGMVALIAVVGAPMLIMLGEMLVGLEGILGIAAAVATPLGAIVAVLGILAVHWLRTGNNMDVFKAKITHVAQYVKNVAWPAIVDGAKRAMAWYHANIEPTISRVAANVKATLSTWGAWLRQFWKRWGDDIIKVVKPAWADLKVVISSAVKVIGGIINTWLAVFRGDWGDAWKSLKGAASSALTLVVAAVKGYVPLLLTAAKILWTGIGTAAKAALKALPGILLSGVKLAAQGIWNLGGWLLGQARELAGNIISGLVAGIEAGAGAVGSALEHIATNALNKAKSALGIHSPSRVFRDEVGRPIMEGIALGMTLGLPAVLTAQAKALEALRAAGQESVDSAQYQSDVAVAAYHKVGTLKAAQNELARARKTQSDRILAADKRIATAEHAITAARKTKGAQDDKLARAELASAKANLALQKAAVGVAAKNVKTVHTLAAAVTATTIALKAAQDAAKKAEDDAQAALDKVQQRQDDLDAALSAIHDSADLALNSDDLNEAIGGGPTVASMRQRLTDLRKEYDDLQAYLKANAAELSAGVQASIVGDMASIMGSINDTTKGVADALKPKPKPDGTTEPGGGDTTTPPLSITQNFSSEPDMFAAATTAAFAYTTVGLVAG